jgi:hypothetical protein
MPSAPPSGVPGTAFYYQTDTGFFMGWTGSAWVRTNGGGYAGGFPSIGRPAAAAGTWANQNGSSVTDVAGGPLVFSFPETGTANDFSAFEFGAPGSAPWTITANLSALVWADNYPVVGIHLRDSGGGKALIFGFQGFTPGNSSPLRQLVVSELNSLTSFNAGLLGLYVAWGEPRWLRIVNDATHLTCFASENGIAWIQVYQQAVAAWLPAITEFGVIGCYSFSASGSGSTGAPAPAQVASVYSLKLDANTTGTNPTY